MLSTKHIIKSFNFFFRYDPVRLILLFIITLITGFNQGASIVMLIPLLNMLSNDTSNNSLISKLLARIGLTPSLEVILIIFIVLLIATSLLTYIKARLQAQYEQGFVYSVRSRLFKKIIGCEWLQINRISKHNNIQVITSEIPKMVTYYYSLLRFISGVIIIVAHIAVSFFISAKFTLIVMAVGLLAFWILRRLLSEAAIVGNKQMVNFRRMIKEIDDFWIMIKQAKIHNSENFYFERFNRINQHSKELQNRQATRQAVSQLIFSITGVVALVFIVYFSIRVEQLPIASLLILIMLFARIFPLFISANSDLNLLLSTISSAILVIQTDEELQENTLRHSTYNKKTTIQGDIHLKNITFEYQPNQPVIRNLSLIIHQNAITGISGASGSGKTTLLDILSGLIKPQYGSITVGETTITESKLPEWQSIIGYLTQDSYFVDGTIRENLIWDSTAEITDEDIYLTLEKVNAREIVEREPNKLSTSISNYSYHFSGGERQRLALARVLLRKPRYLILDEATSALDSATETSIIETITKLKNSVTIIFVTHKSNLNKHFDSTFNLKQ